MTRSQILLLVASAALASGVAEGQQEPTRAIRLRPPKQPLRGEYTLVTSIRELDSRTILIADRGENRVVALDLESGIEKTLGRVGDGPGEYRGVGWLYRLRGDSTLLTDWQSRRWYLLAGQRVVATIGAAETLNRVLGPLLFGFDASGRVLGVLRTLSIDATGPVQEPLVVGVMRTERVDTIGRLYASSPVRVYARRPSAAGTSRPPAQSLLDSEEQAVLFSDGWIAVARLNPYRVDWRDNAGSWRLGKPVDVAAVRPTDEFKCFVFAGYRVDRSRSCEARAEVSWPDRAPAFLKRLADDGMRGAASANLWSTPQGSVLVRRTPLPEGNRYDLVDRRGQLEGYLMLPLNETVIGFGVGSIYLLVTDEDDVQRIRRHAWP